MSRKEAQNFRVRGASWLPGDPAETLGQMGGGDSLSTMQREVVAWHVQHSRGGSDSVQTRRETTEFATGGEDKEKRAEDMVRGVEKAI